jgi:hypothetical protein
MTPLFITYPCLASPNARELTYINRVLTENCRKGLALISIPVGKREFAVARSFTNPFRRHLREASLYSMHVLPPEVGNPLFPIIPVVSAARYYLIK